MKKVVIIGVGIVGLVLVICFKVLGYDVIIYEKNEKVGGRMY